MRLLVLVAVLGGCGSPKPVAIDKGVRSEFSLDLDALANRSAGVEQAVRVIKDRVERARLTAAVFARGEAIVVDLAALDPEAMEAARSLITHTGRLDVQRVDSNAPLMRQLSDRVAADPNAVTAGITAEHEEWAVPDGTRHVDYYLHGLDRRSLERYLADLRSQDATLQPADDHQFAYERVEDPAYPRRPYWRTYYVERRPMLTNAAYTNARATEDRVTHRPTVVIDLADASAESFGKLTSRIVGEKVALILDDRVANAPIINEPITGGRIALALAGSLDEARALAIVIASGPLPTAIRLERVAEIDGDKLLTVDEEGRKIAVPRN